MREGVDFSGTYPAAEALRAAGRDFVVRYVSRPGRAKNLTPAEVSYWRSQGIDIAIVFELTAGRALEGRAAGRDDAAAGRDQVRNLGGPWDPVIYFAVDVDVTSTAQMDAVGEYLAGAAEAIGLPQVGVYGEYDVIEYASARDRARWFWQTYAWSGGRLHAAAHLYQYRNAQSIGGVAVDFTRAYRDNFGQWAGVAQEDDMASYSDSERAEILAAARQVNGAVQQGQVSYAATVQAIGGNVQGLINRVNQLAGQVSNGQAVVLGALAALPPAAVAEMSPEDRDALAAQIAAEIGLTPETILDALHARLEA